MTPRNDTWDELATRLDALGLKLKLHREQAGDTGAADVLQTLGRSLEEVFDAAGKAVNDDAVRTDVKEAGRLLADLVRGAFR
jgi:hypothetical protein